MKIFVKILEAEMPGFDFSLSTRYEAQFRQFSALQQGHKSKKCFLQFLCNVIRQKPVCSGAQTASDHDKVINNILQHSIADFFSIFNIRQVFFSISLSHIMRKMCLALCKNKDTHQLCSNRTADQPLCFRLADSFMPLLLKSATSTFYILPLTVTAQGGLCQTWLETPKTVFLVSQLRCKLEPENWSQTIQRN